MYHEAVLLLGGGDLPVEVLWEGVDHRAVRWEILWLQLLRCIRFSLRLRYSRTTRPRELEVLGFPVVSTGPLFRWGGVAQVVSDLELEIGVVDREG